MYFTIARCLIANNWQVVGTMEIVYALVWTDGLNIGWSSLVIGILYILCGFSGMRAGIAKHVYAARQVG